MKYSFVDFIRFWAMLSIIYIHTLQASNVVFNMQENLLSLGYLYDWLQLPLKFGTVCFYIISGFLLGDKLLNSSPVTFLRRRLNNTLKPYFVSLVLFVLWLSLRHLLGPQAQINISYYFNGFLLDFKETLLYSSYWFIWNFFVALSIIILFRKFLFTAIFPVLLLATTLFYSANIYLKLFETEHTTAVFGFVFYLWLGVFLHRHQKQLKQFIDKTPLSIFILIALAFVMLNQLEANLLYKIQSTDPQNTLKISNQLFSLCMFLILMKISDIGVPGFFNPRKETFGIYLYHMFFVVLFARLIKYTPLKFVTEERNAVFIIAIFIVYFVFTYLGAIQLVKVLNKTPLAWMIGNNKSPRSEQLDATIDKVNQAALIS